LTYERTVTDLDFEVGLEFSVANNRSDTDDSSSVPCFVDKVPNHGTARIRDHGDIRPYRSS
jgi:hypothetical protein